MPVQIHNFHPRIESGRNTTDHTSVQWVTILPNHEQSIGAVGDHVLPGAEKEQVKESPEPTQQELMMRPSHQAGFSKTVGGGSILQNKTAVP